jgi:hypothetical protein
MVRNTINRVDLTAIEEEILHNVLRKILSNATKTGSGKRFTETLRFEFEEDQYEALMLIYARL